MWMLLVLLYGVLKGAREIVKKKALTKSSVIEVLFFYTLLGFLFVTPQAPSAMGLEPKYYFWIALKSFVIFLASAALRRLRKCRSASMECLTYREYCLQLF